MKNVILNHDDDLLVFSVPDEVADNLDEYCNDFRCNWLWKNPNSEKYRHIGKDDATGKEYVYVSYTSTDFIEYLNKWIFPESQSVLIDNLGLINEKDISEKYKDCQRYHF